MENAALELEKNAIALSLQQQVTSALIADLATARLRIRELEAQLEAAKPKP